MIKITLFFSTILFSLCLHSADREISFEWETTPGAKGYEVEVSDLDGKVVKKIKFKKNQFTFKMSAGRYQLRARSIDSRSLPGPWSVWEPIAIPPPKVSLTQAKSQTLTVSRESLMANLQLKWPALAHVDAYKIKVLDSEGHSVQDVDTTHPEISLQLPIGDYRIEVVSLKDGIMSPDKAEYPVKVIGAKLAAVDILNLSLDETHVQVKWSDAIAGAYFVGALERHDIDAKDEWEEVSVFADYESTNYVVQTDARPGVYRVRVQAYAKGWRPSDVTTKEFIVKPKSRDLSSIADEAKVSFDFSKISN